MMNQAPSLLVAGMIDIPPVGPADKAYEIVITQPGQAQAERPVFLYAVYERRIFEIQFSCPDAVEIVGGKSRGGSKQDKAQRPQG